MGGLEPMADLLAGIKQRLTDLESRPQLDYTGSIDAATSSFTGVVSSTWAFGKPTVLLDRGQSVSGPVSAYLPPNNQGILPGSNVILSRLGGSDSPVWYIETDYGVPNFLPQIPIPLNTANSFYNYGNGPSDTLQEYGESQVGSLMLATDALTRPNYGYATMTSTGIVHLMGLAINNTVRAVGDIICTLPPEMWPSRTQLFEINNSSAYGTAYITTDGNVRCGTAYTAGSGIRLDSFTFRAKGYGTFVPLAPMINSWVEYTASVGVGDAGGAGSHTPGYTIDSDGVVIFEGMIAGGANSTIVFQCTALGTQATDLFASATAAGSGSRFRFGGSNGTGIGNYLYAEVVSSTWSSLANIVVIPSSSTTLWIPPAFYNTWSYYNPAPVGQYNNLGWAKTPEGMCFSRGMIQAGTVGATAPIALIGKGWKPRYWFDGISVANAAFAMPSIGTIWTTSPSPNTQGSGFTLGAGSNVWTSMANIAWPAHH